MRFRIGMPFAAALLAGSTAAALAQNSAADQTRGQSQPPAIGVQEEGPAVPSAKMNPAASPQGQMESPRTEPPAASAKMEPETPQGAAGEAQSGNVGSSAAESKAPK